MSNTAAVLSELAIALLNAYMLAAKQAGLTKEQAKEEFNKNYTTFMTESATPVDEVKKD